MSGRVFGWMFVGVLLVLVAMMWWGDDVGRALAPDVPLQSIRGEQVRLSDLRGQVVVVNFWATSCTPCVREMPALSKTYRAYASRGVQIWAVAMSYDRPDLVADFSRRFALPFPVALDLQGDLARAFDRVDAVPTTFLIDRDGRIVKRYLGEIDFADLHDRLDAALPSTP